MEDFLPLKKLLNYKDNINRRTELKKILQDKNIPRVLKEYYIQFGDYKDLNHAQNNLVSPNKLTEISNYVIFYTENQCVAQWGISKKDLSKNNPPVYVTYDEETFLKESDTLSDFLTVMGFLNICLSMEYSTEEFYFIDKNTYNKIISKYNLVGKIDWCGTEIYQDHNDDIIYISNNVDDFTLLYSSNNEKHFNALDDYIMPLIENMEDF